MIIFINGAFGVGKTTVAKELRKRLPGTAIFDPEKVGFVLQHLPRYQVSDFQDIPAWRQLTIRGIRFTHTFRQYVIVPMAFSNLAYLDEIRDALTDRGHNIIHFCLTAPLDVIQQRLGERGADVNAPGNEWVFRRAAECCQAHTSDLFQIHVDAAHHAPEAIAAQLLQTIFSLNGPED